MLCLKKYTIRIIGVQLVIFFAFWNIRWDVPANNLQTWTFQLCWVQLRFWLSTTVHLQGCLWRCAGPPGIQHCGRQVLYCTPGTVLCTTLYSSYCTVYCTVLKVLYCTLPLVLYYNLLLVCNTTQGQGARGQCHYAHGVRNLWTEVKAAQRRHCTL